MQGSFCFVPVTARNENSTKWPHMCVFELVTFVWLCVIREILLFIVSTGTGETGTGETSNR